MAGLDNKLITAYNATRSALTDRSIICHAPFTNINFEQNGNATACCYNRKHVLGTYPATSIRDMWFGKQADILRNYIKNNDLGGGCRMCKLQLESGNYSGFKAKLYDEYATGVESKTKTFFKRLAGNTKPSMPKVMEFELENTCNLECIMCNGHFSSSIRKNREKLPAIESPYDVNFVSQLTAFMPYLTDMKFLGGEPFMIDIYNDIWEQVARINPAIRIHITTNATLLNSRTKRLLEGMMAGISLSIDSVKKETYEAIRIGASYEKVMENIDWLTEYTKRKKTYIGFTVCPMLINRYEIVDIVRYANERGLSVFFNTVWWPEDQSLRFMSYDELDELIRFYESDLPEQKTSIAKNNYAHLIGFINQLKFWRTEKVIPGTAEAIPDELYEYLKNINVSAATDRSDLAREILRASIIAINPEDKQFLDQESELLTMDVRSYLKKLLQVHSSDQFLTAYFDCLDWIASGYLTPRQQLEFRKKTGLILDITAKLTEKDLLIADLVRSGVPYQVNYIATTDSDEIIRMVKEHYN